MVVQHNLRAMNSNRMLGLTQSTQAKSTEKLSSGYKINRAADDAAGLSISEKMRKQIRGLTQASANAQDGISTVQTAEGALNEVQDMLQRMNELAVKASNGTMSESDRKAVQSEVDQLVTEIDRVATTTKFNETYLLKGNNKGSVGALTYTTAKSGLESKLSAANSLNTTTGTISLELKAESARGLGYGVDGTTNGYFTGDLAGTDAKFKSYTVSASGAAQTTYVFVESTSQKDGVTTKKLSVSETVDKLNAKDKVKAFSSLDDMMSAIKADFGENVKSVNSYLDGDAGSAKLKLKVETFADLNDAVDVSLHVGADSSSDNKITMNIAQMGARGLGINGIKVSGETADNATKAIDTIADALAKVSAQRSTLGAVQNRLEHTINNLDNVVENTTSAESAIRDTDMANEMVRYSNNNILSQAGQSMLAQSNQSNQGVLSLLG